MIIINEADRETGFIWGKQKPVHSRYRIYSYVIREGNRLHNSVTGKTVELTSEELAFLQTRPETLTELIQDWFLVPQEHEDKKSVDILRRNIQALHKSQGLGYYTILPTTACNASCFYCYEYGMPVKTMTRETADLTAEFILNNTKSGKIQLRWFGGEPLLGRNTISEICSKLKEHSIEFESLMVTNGYLFDDQLINEASSLWNLKKVQITLDGTAEIYNKVKGYKDADDSPFTVVTGNIKKLLDKKIYVCVRVNMGLHNYDDLSELIHYLAGEFKDKRYFSADVRCLYEGEGREPVMLSDDEREFLEDKARQLRNDFSQNGITCHNLENVLPKLKASFCMADDDRAVLINPEGKTGKCEHSIFEHLTDDNDIEKDYWKEKSEYTMCASCKLYPSCIRLKNCANLKHCSEQIKNRKIQQVKRAIAAL